MLSDGKVMVLVTLGYQKSHEMSEDKGTKAIFISSTELRNTYLVSFRGQRKHQKEFPKPWMITTDGTMLLCAHLLGVSCKTPL